MARWKLDSSSALPRHAQVEHLLRALISQQSYVNGKPLPGEVELSERLQVSRQTVRQAMSRLVHDGLIERRRNAGTRVVRRPLITNLTDWTSFTAEMNRQGVRMRTVNIQTELAPPPDDVAKFFKLKRSDAVLSLARVRADDDGPVVEFRSWLHPRLGLTASDDFSQPLYELIECRAGIIPSRSTEQIGAMLSDATHRISLGCTGVEPILTRRRYVSEENGLAVEVCDCFYRANRFNYTIELQREDR